MTFNVSYMNNPGMMLFPTNERMWADFIVALTNPELGDVVVTEQILIPAGSLAAPGLAFSTETNTGLYQSEPGILLIGVSGEQFFELTTSGTNYITANARIKATAGSIGAPALVLHATDTDTGLYYISSGRIGIASNATLRLDIHTTGVSVTGTLSATGAVSGTTGTFTDDVTSAGRVGTVTNYANADSPQTLSTHEVISCDTSAGDVVLNLPAAASNDGRKYIINNSGAVTGTGTVQVVRNSASDTIGGQTTHNIIKTVADKGRCSVIVCDAANADWIILANNVTTTGSP